MLHVTFHVRTLTPLFLAGSDQQTAELRAPAFRGLMRYWLRTTLGNLVIPGTNDIQQVIEQEKTVFGATDTGSPVLIKLQPVRIQPVKLYKSKGIMPGRDYLLWSVLERRFAIPERTTFQITLSIRSNQEDKNKGKKALECAIGAFWLLTHLGGIGSRGRRGAGSLSVVEVQDDISTQCGTDVKGDTDGISFTTPTSVKQLQSQLEKGIQKIRELTSQVSPKQEALFDTLAAGTCRIWILLDDNGQPWDDTNTALDDIGKKLRLYRQHLSPDFPLEARKIFGIPVMEYKGGRSAPIPIRGAGKLLKRQASPLHLRLSEIQIEGERRYVGVATLFKTRWKDMSDTDYQLYRLIKRWVKQEFATAREVQL